GRAFRETEQRQAIVQRLERYDFFTAEYLGVIGGPGQAREILFGDVIDEQRRNFCSQIGIVKLAPGPEGVGADLRQVFWHGQSAVGRQPFEQNVGKRLRRHSATRGQVFHRRFSTRRRVILVCTKGKA